jgi:hypothetical protein
VDIFQILANGSVFKFFHSQVPVLSHYLENILTLLFVLDGFLHQLLLLFFDLLPVKQAASLLNVFLRQDDVLEVLV